METNGLPVLNVSHPFAFHGFYGSNNESGMPSSLVETVNFDLKLIVKLLLIFPLLRFSFPSSVSPLLSLQILMPLPSETFILFPPFRLRPRTFRQLPFPDPIFRRTAFPSVASLHFPPIPTLLLPHRFLDLLFSLL